MLTTRRRLLTGAAAGAAFAGLARYAAAAEDPYVSQLAGYGPLRPDPRGVFDLPEGFSYTVVSRAGEPMSDGLATPSKMDGMGCFGLGGDRVALVRNHELSPGEHGVGPFGRTRGRTEGPAASLAYDLDGDGRILAGGTSTLVYDLRRQTLERSHLSLVGTIKNCAGGVTPWGSWLTCEETTDGPAQGWGKQHGYIFEVPVSAEDEVEAVPLEAMGRFVHEAVAVDAESGIVYETEDRFLAGFYRFIPAQRGVLRAGGKLQMLAVEGRRNVDLAHGQRMGARLPVTWVDIDDPDRNSPWDSHGVFAQGYDRGGARFSRLEGCWYGDRSIFFHATNGGDAGRGQVWQYRATDADSGELTLVFESPSAEVLDSPDNLTVSPRGGVVICEDGSGEQYIRGLTRDGRIFDFAKNLANNDEFAGACFSPDGRTLFLNIMGSTIDAGPSRGMTFAIWGPWQDGAL